MRLRNIPGAQDAILESSLCGAGTTEQRKDTGGRFL